MHLPTLPRRLAPDDGRVTATTRGQPDRGDKTAGRRRASGRARWGQRERRREGKRHGSHGSHGSQEEQKDKRSGGGNKEEHGSRQGAGRDQTDRGKKERYKYLRERREKNAAETRKSVQVCAYTYHLISRRGGCLLHFLLYILRGYIVYIYIYNIHPSNVYFSFKVNGI